MTESTLAIVDQQPKLDGALLQFARDWQVTDPDTADMAGAKIEQIRSTVTRMKQWFRPLKAAAYAAHKKLVAAENDAVLPLQDSQDILTKKVHSWQSDVRRAERIEEARRLEEARRVFAAQRLDESKQREAAQKQADADALDLAERLKASGVEEDVALETAMELAEPTAEPIDTPPVYALPAPTASKVAGVRAKRRRWNYRIIRLDQVCWAISAGKIPVGVIEIKHAQMLDFAKLHGATLRGSIPGIQFYEEE